MNTMDADVFSNEIILYLSREEIIDLLLGGCLLNDFKTEDTNKNIVVDIEGPSKSIEENDEYHDDVLKALEQAYILIESMRYSYDEIDANAVNVDKIQNTYLYYKQIQEEYR